MTLYKGIMWAKECLYLRYRGERQGEKPVSPSIMIYRNRSPIARSTKQNVNQSINQSINQSKEIYKAPKSKVCSKALMGTKKRRNIIDGTPPETDELSGVS